jgi:hypothetical protein
MIESAQSPICARGHVRLNQARATRFGLRFTDATKGKGASC